MMPRTQCTLGLLFCVLLGACLEVKEANGIVFTNFESLLAPRLRPGSQEIYDFSTRGRNSVDNSGSWNPRLTGFTQVDGSGAVLVDPYPLAIDSSPGGAVIYNRSSVLTAVPDGSLTVTPLYNLPMEMVASAHTPSLLLQAWCAPEERIRVGRSYLPVPNAAWCSNPAIMGAAADDDHLLLAILAGAGAIYELSVVTEAAGNANIVVVPSGLTWPAGVDLAAVRFIDSPAAGVLAVVSESAGQWTYAKTGASAVAGGTALAGVPFGSEPVRRGTDGVLRIATDAALYTWDPDGPGTVGVLSVSPPPTIKAPWVSAAGWGVAIARETKPNPKAPALTIPVAVQARVIDNDRFLVVDVPTTPCTSTELCRGVGESRVLGVVGEAGSRHAVYEVWLWHLRNDADVTGIWSAPFSP